MKPIHLTAFKMAGVGHTAIGLWRHPDSQAHRYKELGYWLETARTLEAGGFDALFIADFLGLYDAYNQSPEASFREAIAVPLDDPLLLVSAMASVTTHLGFGITVSTSYEQPYSFARKMTTLDHLTNGRVGWNIVTSALESAARNLGVGRQVHHDERYAIADEFMEVVYRLWEGSWEDDAVVLDRDNNVFADPAKIHGANHRGKYFTVPDPFMCEPSVQRTPVLFQAGGSATGKAFGARHAEAVFLVDPSVSGMRKLVSEVKALAAARGRNPESIKFLAGLSVVTAPTDDEAKQKFDDLISYISVEGTLARLSSLMQLDFGSIDLDKPLKFVETDGIRIFLERFTRNDPDRSWTPREAAAMMASSLGALTIVGSPRTVADRLEAVVLETGVDGFNLYDYMPLRCMPEFIELVVPELRRRGRMRVAYEGTTLRENLCGAGPRLPLDHPGAAYGGSSK